jgi:hypothetical protein
LKKLAFLGVAIGLGVGVLLVAHTTHASDHLDSPAAIANPMADIGDIYAWTNSDATKVNLVMTVSPADPGTRHFDSSVQYVFHVNSKASVDAATATETKVICTFQSDTSIQCWVGDKGYVTGDPSANAGLASSDSKIRVFAGRRSDPFFFNLNGYKDAVTDVEAGISLGLLGSGNTNVAGCPLIPPANGSGLRAVLDEPAVGSGATHAPCSGSSADCFIDLDVMAIVVQVDKTLLNQGTNKLIGVWGSTHAAM